MSPFFTTCHSTRNFDAFVALLRESRVGLVVDVRTIPRSRTSPQYDRDTLPDDTLPDALAGFRIGQAHIATLGGRRGKLHGADPSANGYWRVASFHD